MAEEAELQEDKAMAWLQAVSESEEGQQLREMKLFLSEKAKEGIRQRESP